MNQQMKVIPVCDVPFYVDVDNRRLIEKGNMANVLYLGYMDLKENGYYFEFDPQSKGFLRSGSQQEIPVVIDHLVKIDPEAMAANYGIKVAELPETDLGLQFNKELLTERLRGVLPRIKICGHPFFVDLRLGLLRPKDDFGTMGIRLADLPMDAAGTVYQGFYHKKRHCMVELDEKLTTLPKDILPIEIPYDNVLDPLGFAMQISDLNGLSDRYPIGNAAQAAAVNWKETGMEDFFNHHPLRKNLEARVVPWEHTLIPDIIKENKERQKLLSAGKKGKGGGLKH